MPSLPVEPEIVAKLGLDMSIYHEEIFRNDIHCGSLTS